MTFSGEGGVERLWVNEIGVPFGFKDLDSPKNLWNLGEELMNVVFKIGACRGDSVPGRSAKVGPAGQALAWLGSKFCTLVSLPYLPESSMDLGRKEF